MATRSVTISYGGGSGGAVSPSSVSVGPGDKIDFSADGSKTTITFPDDRIFGVEHVSVADGTTETVTVADSPPTGTFECPVHCHAVKGGQETTPALDVGVTT